MLVLCMHGHSHGLTSCVCTVLQSNLRTKDTLGTGLLSRGCTFLRGILNSTMKLNVENSKYETMVKCFGH